MSNQKRLAEIADIRQGRYLAPTQMFDSASVEALIPVWGANGVLGYTEKPTYTYRVPLVTCRGNGCGLVQWPNEKSYISNNAMGVEPKTKTKSDSNYLYYSLLACDFSDVITGSAQPQITVSHLSSKTVTWVDDENVRSVVANILSCFDRKVDINRRINQTLEAMAQSIFKSWFVDFDPVKAKIAAKAEGRDPLRSAMTAISGKPDAELDALPQEQFASLAAAAALFPDEMEESELGVIPEGWTIQSMAQLTTKIGSGSTPRGGKEVYVDAGIALIRSQNVYDSLFVWEGLARITDEAAAQLKGVTVQEDDVLLNITGASILRTCVVLPDVLPARVNQHVAIIRAKASVPPRFLHQYLLLPETKNHLLGLNAGGSREAVTKAHIESLKLLVPSSDLLAAFGALVTPIFKQVESCARETQSLAELRDTLLPKLLSGELQVQDAEMEADA